MNMSMKVLWKTYEGEGKQEWHKEMNWININGVVAFQWKLAFVQDP